MKSEVVSLTQFGSTIFGALIAAFFGYLTHLLINHRLTSTTNRRSCYILLNDIRSIMSFVNSLEFEVEYILEKNPLAFNNQSELWDTIQIRYGEGIIFSNDWYVYLANISEFLTVAHIKSIQEVYFYANLINKELKGSNLVQLSRIVNKIKSRNTIKKFIELTTYEISSDLLSILKHSRISKYKYKHKFDINEFNKHYLETKSEIELLAISILFDGQWHPYNDVTIPINNWFQSQPDSYRRKYDENWLQIVFETLYYSCKIEYAFGWCRKVEH